MRKEVTMEIESVVADAEGEEGLRFRSGDAARLTAQPKAARPDAQSATPTVTLLDRPFVDPTHSFVKFAHDHRFTTAFLSKAKRASARAAAICRYRCTSGFLGATALI